MTAKISIQALVFAGRSARTVYDMRRIAADLGVDENYVLVATGAAGTAFAAYKTYKYLCQNAQRACLAIEDTVTSWVPQVGETRVNHHNPHVVIEVQEDDEEGWEVMEKVTGGGEETTRETITILESSTSSAVAKEDAATILNRQDRKEEEPDTEFESLLLLAMECTKAANAKEGQERESSVKNYARQLLGEVDASATVKRGRAASLFSFEEKKEEENRVSLEETPRAHAPHGSSLEMKGIKRRRRSATVSSIHSAEESHEDDDAFLISPTKKGRGASYEDAIELE